MGKKRVLILLGPNLNLVGIREKGVYGDETAESIQMQIVENANRLGYDCEIFQSNHECDLIDKIHAARESFHGVIRSGGAFYQSRARTAKRNPVPGRSCWVNS